MKKNIKRLKKHLKKPQKIVLTMHDGPDADALGSSLALYSILQKMGHTVSIISPSICPKSLKWMDGYDKVLAATDENMKDVNTLFQHADTIICLDLNHLSRVHHLGPLIKNSKTFLIMIDHHPFPDDFADISIWDERASSTCEIIFDVIHGLKKQKWINTGIGNLIYAGILTDTGQFKHVGTSQKTHKIVAKLMDIGVDTTWVAHELYDSNTIQRLRFLGHVLSHKLVVLEKFRTAYITISEEERRQFNLRIAETEGLVDYALSIKGIVLAALIIEKNNTVRLSLRSVGDLCVNEIARQHFNGGGHFNAAGGKSEISLEETAKKFESLLPDLAVKINKAMA